MDKNSEIQNSNKKTVNTVTNKDSVYYTIEELMELYKNGESIDFKKVNPDMMNLLSFINGEKSSSEKDSTVDAGMYEVNLEDVKYANDYAKQYTEKLTGEKFNDTNIIHRDYFERAKKQVLDNLSKNMKIRQMEQSLMEKYGESFSELEQAVRKAFENLTFKDARSLLLSRRNGDIDKIMLFYDNIYKDMSKKRQEQERDRAVNYPPRTISGADYSKTDRKDISWQDFI